jgi:hypothetical protein
MTTEPTSSSNLPDSAHLASAIDRVAAIMEVVLAFSLVHLTYRSFKHFTVLGRQEGAAGLNFSPGVVMILFTVALLLIARRNFEEYGLTLKGWRYCLNVGVLWGVLIVLTAGTVIKLGLVHFDPLHPPDLTRALVFSAGEVIVTLLLIVFLRKERRQRVPTIASVFVLIGLLLLPVVLAIVFHRGVANVWPKVLWLFFFAPVLARKSSSAATSNHGLINRLVAPGAPLACNSASA